MCGGGICVCRSNSSGERYELSFSSLSGRDVGCGMGKVKKIIVVTSKHCVVCPIS